MLHHRLGINKYKDDKRRNNGDASRFKKKVS